MSLASAKALSSIPDTVLGALGARLRASGFSTALADALKIGRGVAIELRRPIRLRRLRARDDDAARLLRLLCFGDALEAGEAVSALGDSTLRALLDGELLANVEGKIVAQLVLTAAEDILCFGDPFEAGAEAIMAIGVTTRALAKVGRGRGRLALDLGCGGGALALSLAPHFERVIATDLAPRAAVIARLNLALAQVDNVEVRIGDRFAPVAGERFDLVVCQPPFLSALPDASSKTLHGGTRGDELPRAILAELPRHLAEGGRAVVFTQWPVPPPIDVGSVIGDPTLGVFLLEAPPLSLDEQAAVYASAEVPVTDDGYPARARAHREQAHRLGLTAVIQTVVVLDRRFPGVVARVPLASARVIDLSADRVEDAVRARVLLAGGGLAQARLRLSPGVRFASLVGARGAPPQWVAFAEKDPLVERTFLNAATLDLLRTVASAKDVATAVAAVGPRHGVPAARGLEVLGKVVAGALEKGILRVDR